MLLKQIRLVLVILILAFVFSISAASTTQKKVQQDSYSILADSFQTKTMIPFTLIAKWFDMDIQYRPVEETIILEKKNYRFEFSSSPNFSYNLISPKIIINGKEIKQSDDYDSALLDGIIYVPTGAFLKFFGASATYDSRANLVILTYYNKEVRQIDVADKTLELKNLPVKADSPEGNLRDWVAYSPDGTKFAHGNFIFEQKTGWIVGRIFTDKGFAWHPDSVHYATMTHQTWKGNETIIEVYGPEGKLNLTRCPDVFYHFISYASDGKSIYLKKEIGDPAVSIPATLEKKKIDYWHY